MDKRLLTSALLCCCLGGYAQDLKTLLEKGDRFYARKDFIDAVDIYNQAVSISPDDAQANFKLGMAYLYTESKSKALPYLEKAYQAKPDVDEDFDYHIGLAYQYSHQYGKARDHFIAFQNKNKKLADVANHKIHECTIGDSLVRHPTYVDIQNAGNLINSPFHEYSPLLSADGQTIIFTSNRSEDDYKIKSGTNFEDIYIARKSGSTWGTPQKISPNINIKFHDAAASLSPDGKTLFLYYEEGAGDIYTATLEKDWSKPVPLNKNINTPLFWETSACVSADGKKLYFTSNRPGGRGELDIYVSELDANGNWGKASNLGAAVNTPGNEDSPFIHPDGVTLYFSSDGHPSMGSNDIFKSEFKNGKWTKPVNLGYPINSIEYDGFFSISADKKTGYYSTIREDGHGDSDIYVVKFLDPPAKKEEKPVVIAAHEEPPVLQPVAESKPAVAKPDLPAAPAVTLVVGTPEAPAQKNAAAYVDPIIQVHHDMKVVTLLKGKVIDEVTAAPLSAVVTLVDNQTHKVVSRINVDGTTGDFELVVPHGGNYGVTTDRAGYLFNSINFSVPQFAAYQEIDMHIIMVKATVGSKVTLKNIFFDTGKADLKAESLSELEKIRELLTVNAHLKVQINGHTDNTGNATSNKLLSLKRAESVVQYLVSHGIEATKLSAKGYGSERPLVSNDDEAEGRELNRRTEIEIVEAQ
ncbi:MAG TPA: OmpA family protein [Ohtaekwangia sp.]|nr:OmpA family protein [Ohtaekwangia sp.]